MLWPMNPRALSLSACASLVAVSSIVGSGAESARLRQSPLRQALTFHAPFDGSTNARVALGDPALYSASARKAAATATPGAPADAIAIAPGAGRHGDALRVRLGASPFVFYKGEKNIAWQPRDWSGTVVLWMSLDPDADLAPGYSDPLIITPRAWNDAALFVDFTRDDVPRRFRFAAFADRTIWDPAMREWEAVAVAERPMVELTGKRFARGAWTQVAWTWSRFNAGGTDGVLTCYLNGEKVGTLDRRPQVYTWDPREVSIALGVQFIGLMDDLAIFNRALDAAEIQTLYTAPRGVAGL
jgi:hypothetical protein